MWGNNKEKNDDDDETLLLNILERMAGAPNTPC